MAGLMTDPEGRVRAWRTLAILFATAVLAYTDRQVMSLFVEPMRRSMGLSDMQIGLLIGTAFGCIYAIAGLPMGWVADRTSRARLLVLGAAVWTVGTIGCGLATGFAPLFLWRLVVGVGESVLSPASVSMIGDLFPPHMQGRALAIYFMGIEAGGGMSMIAGGALLELSGAVLPIAPWRGVFLLLGAGGILLVLVLLATLREPRRTTRKPATGDGERHDPPHLATAACVFASVACMSLMDNSVGAWAPTILTRGLHIGMARTGLLLGPCFIIGGSLGVLSGGWCADRVALHRGWRGKLALLWPACFAYPVLSLALLGTDLRTTLVAITGLFMMSGFVAAAGLSTIVDLVAPGRRGFATALAFFLNVMVGAGLGPVLTVFVAKHLVAGPLDVAIICLGGVSLLPTGAALLWVSPSGCVKAT